MSTSVNMTDLVLSDTAEESDAGAVEAAEHPAMELLNSIQSANKEVADRAKATDGMLKALRKDMKKLCKKRRRASGAPSNLMRPIELSPELCSFLGKDAGSKMTRGQVTSAINNYATEKNIKKQHNGRVIVVDPPLAGLLGLAVGEEVQIFHVQTHLKTKNHYVKDPVAV